MSLHEVMAECKIYHFRFFESRNAQQVPACGNCTEIWRWNIHLDFPE